MSGQTYTCDCGINYSHPDQVIACANNMHGRPATSAELRDGMRSELTRLRAREAVWKDALEYVPRWEAGHTVFKCLGCGYEYPLTYDTASLNALHGKDCWVDRIERALATLDVEEKM